MTWRPAHATHAIERVNLTLAFQEQVPSRFWQPLIDEATGRFQAQGFGIVPMQPQMAGINGPGLQIVFNAAPIPNASPAPAPADRSFLLMEGAFPTEEAHVGRQQINYGVNKYQSWGQLSDRIATLLKPLVDKSLEITNIGLLKLEYWDRFTHFDRPPEEANYSDILKRGSSHVPYFVFDTHEMFHSHSGYFTRNTPTKRLVNINIDAVDIGIQVQDNGISKIVPHRSVGIYTMAQDTFSAEQALNENFDSALSKLDEMHSILKELLDGAITTDMSSRIGLLQGSQG